MYYINLRTNINPEVVIEKLKPAIDQAGFTADLEAESLSSSYPDLHKIKVATVRLKEAKSYCGNHPGPCKIKLGGDRPHRNLKYLEGGDWVIFNDTVNDVLDELEVNAYVSSKFCVIRWGVCRRIHYGSIVHPGGHVDWDKLGEVGHYACYVGRKAPRATAPWGTPAYEAA